MRRALILIAVLGILAGCGAGGDDEPVAPAEPPKDVNRDVDPAEPHAAAVEMRFAVEGMYCGGCAGLIAAALREVEGVVSVDLTYESKVAVVRAAEGVTPDAILAATPADYTLTPE